MSQGSAQLAGLAANSNSQVSAQDILKKLRFLEHQQQRAAAINPRSVQNAFNSQPAQAYERVSDCPALPKGWKRKEVLRQAGVSGAKVEVVYISPSGRVISNKAQLEKYLAGSWELSRFDFESGRVYNGSSPASAAASQSRLSATNAQLQQLARLQQQQQQALQRNIANRSNLANNNRVTPYSTTPQQRRAPQPTVAATLASLQQRRHQLPPQQQHQQQPSNKQTHIAPRPAANQTAHVGNNHVAASKPAAPPAPTVDHTTQAPIRQTASIFRQPVTLVLTSSRGTKPAPPNEVKESKAGANARPSQIFWAKRLGSMTAACMVHDTENATVEDGGKLSACLEPMGPVVDTTATIASLARSLALEGAVTGQLPASQRALFDANPGVHVKAEQPLVQGLSISAEDVVRQQQRIADARRRLEEALKHFG